MQTSTFSMRFTGVLHEMCEPALGGRDATGKEVDVDSPYEGGGSPLVLCGQHGWSEAIGPLLRHGADPMMEDYHGYTALSAAAQYGHAQVVLAVLDDKTHDLAVYIDAPERYVCTPLFLATAFGHEDAVRLLLSRGSTAARTLTSAGRTPLSFANDARKRNIKLRHIWRWLANPDEVSVDLDHVLIPPNDPKDFEVDLGCGTCRYATSRYDTYLSCDYCENYPGLSLRRGICLECFASGERCRDTTHTLKKIRFVRGVIGWEPVSQELVYQTTTAESGKEASIWGLLC